MDNFNYLSYEENDRVGILTLNREDKLNALSESVLSELKTFLEMIPSKKISALLFTGAGEKAFIAGADIASMAKMTESEAFDLAKLGQTVSLMFEDLRIPVIACVNGFALGGGFEMALACDFIMATKNAQFGLPEVSLGLIPGFGGTQRLAKIVGRNKARELIYTGKKIKADEALVLGIVTSLFETKNELINEAKNLALMIQKNSSNAVGIAKAALNQGVDLRNEEGLKIERSAFSEIFNSFDMKEGTAAFIEKRKPNFKGE